MEYIPIYFPRKAKPIFHSGILLNCTYLYFGMNPMGKKEGIKIFSADTPDDGLEVPYVGYIRAGFASPAGDYPAESSDKRT
jgi:hypothetical protein